MGASKNTGGCIVFFVMAILTLIFISVPLDNDTPWLVAKIDYITDNDSWILYSLEGGRSCNNNGDDCSDIVTWDDMLSGFITQDTIDSCKDGSSSVRGIIGTAIAIFCVCFVLQIVGFVFSTTRLAVFSKISIVVYVVACVVLPIAAVSTWDSQCHNDIKDDVDDLNSIVIDSVTLIRGTGWILVIVAIITAVLSGGCAVFTYRAMDESSEGGSKPTMKTGEA